MIKMAQAQYIKHLYEEENKSRNEISKITGLNYRTVCKYADKTDWNDRKLPNVEPENYPVLGEFIPLMDEWLEKDRKVPRKQRHTAKRIYERLCEEAGFNGGYSCVKRYVRKKRIVMQQTAAGCLPLNQSKACAQLDFGEFMYYDTSGNEHKAYALTLSFPYSNKGYTQVYPSQNQECLLEGMKRIFEYISGVPIRIKCDNMATAVAQVCEGTERKLTAGFARFMLHYRFKADFCNPASENEKGNVENKVGYSRRNALVPIPTIDSFDKFNEYLFDWCEKDAQRKHYKREVTIQSLWEEEQSELNVLPEVSYDIFRYEVFKVNKVGFVTIDTNKYGLPPELAREIVQAKIFYDKIDFFHNKAHIVTYRRSYGRNEEFMDWTQYVRTLCKKPGAAEHTRFFGSMPRQWQDYLISTQGRERKNALQLLKEIVSDGNAEYCVDILLLSQQNGRNDADSVRQCCYTLMKESRNLEPLEIKADVPVLNYNPDISVYDGLMGGEANG